MKKLELNEKLEVIFNLIQDISWYFGNQCFNGKCCGNLTLVEFMTLKKIYEAKDNNIQNIGIELNITKSGISKIINKLEKKSYVVKRRSPVDGRVCCVEITEMGCDAIQKISKAYTEYLKEALMDINGGEVDVQDIINTLLTLYQVLKKKGYMKYIE